MVLKIWRLIALVLVALYMGLEFSHTLELPAKLQYDGASYVMIQNTLYQYFGAPGPGAMITVGALISTVILVVLVRNHRPAFQWTLAGAIFLVIAFPGIYFFLIEPVNQVMEQATPQSLPANWIALRNQWEYAHAKGFALTFISFCMLLVSLLVDLPTTYPRYTSSNPTVRKLRRF